MLQNWQDPSTSKELEVDILAGFIPPMRAVERLLPTGPAQLLGALYDNMYKPKLGMSVTTRRWHRCFHLNPNYSPVMTLDLRTVFLVDVYHVLCVDQCVADD